MSINQPTARRDPHSRSWHGYEPRSMPEVPPWIKALGRAGHIAKGVVYFIIGMLAFKLAIGAGGELSGSRDAIREIGQQPFGRVLLGLVAIGLLGYTAWRWVQAGKDTEGAGYDAKGVCKRIGYAFSGLAYLALGFFSGSLALGFGSEFGNSQGNAASPLLDSSWGRVLLGIAGAITIGVSFYFAYKAYRAKFVTKYDLSAMRETTCVIALYAGRMGLSTRSVAFAIVGAFMLVSAVRGTADGEVAGMSDALAAIAAQSYGKILIGITGFGLMCYAIHMMLMGWFRKFNVAKSNV
ncbi:DUF1206 domain-containing protein [Rubripirellula reticaptiva]|uniref:DUF1206 domain-containing protein n=1 Tax=Rubripirellula reticaptiva TaxID=2528013 RepID=A0A5C6ET42_9BACT|nr:DUF1206 domain-containing protein [Rubripirellula reticaptiva]TWU51257.1 hypothetical protein Poly59_28490 [Rubripirellula reticaptiva]